MLPRGGRAPIRSLCWGLPFPPGWLVLRGSVFAGLLGGFGLRASGLSEDVSARRSRPEPLPWWGCRFPRLIDPSGSVFAGLSGRFAFRASGLSADVSARRSRPDPLPWWGLPFPPLVGSPRVGLRRIARRVWVLAGGCRFPRLIDAPWVGVHRIVRPVCVLGVGAVRGCFGAAVAPRSAPLVGVTVPPLVGSPRVGLRRIARRVWVPGGGLPFPPAD